MGNEMHNVPLLAVAYYALWTSCIARQHIHSFKTMSVCRRVYREVIKI